MSIVDICKRIFDGKLFTECHSCAKPMENAMVCSECRVATYCSHECLLKQHADHQEVCQLVGAPDKRERDEGSGGGGKKKSQKTGDDDDDDDLNGIPDIVLRLLVQNDGFMSELAQAGLRTIGRWARVSRTFEHYLLHNRLFWFFVLFHHAPHVLGAVPVYSRHTDYSAIVERFMGGLGIPFTRAALMTQEEYRQYDVFKVLAKSEAGLREYLEGTTTARTLELMITSKMFRYHFKDSNLFWFLFGSIQFGLFAGMDGSEEAHDFRDGVRKYIDTGRLLTIRYFSGRFSDTGVPFSYQGPLPDGMTMAAAGGYNQSTLLDACSKRTPRNYELC